jgi:hypothetical protein
MGCSSKVAIMSHVSGMFFQGTRTIFENRESEHLTMELFVGTWDHHSRYTRKEGGVKVTPLLCGLSNEAVTNFVSDDVKCGCIVGGCVSR